MFVSLMYNPLITQKERKAYFIMRQNGWAFVNVRAFELFEF